MKELFNLHKFAGHKRIRDRGINWKEVYGERSAPLKKRFDKMIGEGAYRRWEGHDYTTDSDYFIVVGPAMTKQGKKLFFAGIKKLPPKWKRLKVYAPSGKYFHSIISALGHASRQWGVPFPPNPAEYTADDIANLDIPRHMKG